MAFARVAQITHDGAAIKPNEVPEQYVAACDETARVKMKGPM